MNLQREARQAGAVIALTPLIDVVFILLIFFMLASRFDSWGGLEVSLAAPLAAPPIRPGAAGGATSADEVERSVVLVEVTAGDAVLVGTRRLTLLQLRQLVAEGQARPAGRRPAYVVHAEPTAPVQRLVAVVEALRAAGASEVGLAAAAVGAE